MIMKKFYLWRQKYFEVAFINHKYSATYKNILGGICCTKMLLFLESFLIIIFFLKITKMS